MGGGGGHCREPLINLRLGMVLEVATVAGSLLGGLTAHLFSEATLQRLFAVVTVFAAVAVLARVNRRNVILDQHVDPIAGQRAEPPSCQLGAPGIVDTQKQHCGSVQQSDPESRQRPGGLSAA